MGRSGAAGSGVKDLLHPRPRRGRLTVIGCGGLLGRGWGVVRAVGWSRAARGLMPVARQRGRIRGRGSGATGSAGSGNQCVAKRWLISGTVKELVEALAPSNSFTVPTMRRERRRAQRLRRSAPGADMPHVV